MALKGSQLTSKVENSAVKGLDDFEIQDQYPPMETRFVEVKTDLNDGGSVKKFPALHKRWATDLKCMLFYLPNMAEITENEMAASNWKDYMEMFRDDMRWLLRIPHYQFWSVMIHCPGMSQDALSSFLMRAPRFFDVDFEAYQKHEVIGPLYRDIYVLVFRIFMRLATYKESKEDHITPSKWAALIFDNYLFDIPRLLDLCSLYQGKDNPLLPKMIENVLKHEPRYINELDEVIPVLMKKSNEFMKQLESQLQENVFTQEWDVSKFQDLLTFKIDTIVSIYKFLKIYPAAARNFLRNPQFVPSLAASYENNIKLWGKVLEKLPLLESQVNLLRGYMLRLFRTVLANTTVLSVESSNDHRLDEFFELLTSCLEEKLLIHDYEKAFPFRCDIQALLSRGIFVDETRIDYMANAISSCFHACGEEYSVEKIVVDPLYDPHFDRQLLGACSLDVTGIELQSLITQVKDLLPDLPDSYVEAVLKHYSYKTETTINALLEGSVPTRLEKYKNEDYVKSQMTQTTSTLLDEDPVRDQLPVHFQPSEIETVNSGNLYFEEPKTAYSESLFFDGSFHQGKRSHGFASETQFLDGEKDVLKARILQNLEADAINRKHEILKQHANSKSKNSAKLNTEESDSAYNYGSNDYVDESLLPVFRDEVEYDDEYDDTYDEIGVGMTEPDSWLYNPLNRKAGELEDGKDNRTNVEDREEVKPAKNFDNFVEDPAILRAQMERRREEKMSQRRGYQPERGPRDVTGKPKGQGQDKEVLQNRRQKMMNKDAAANHSRKKRSDWKRKEF